MKDNKDEAIEHIILMEVGPKGLQTGAPHTDPDDPGGFTIWGLSKRAHPWITERTTLAEAVDVYDKVYWRAIKADDLPSGIDFIAADFAVNAGASACNRLLETLPKIHPTVDDFVAERDCFYADLVHRKPSLVKFLKGWQTRTRQVTQIAKQLERKKC